MPLPPPCSLGNERPTTNTNSFIAMHPRKLIRVYSITSISQEAAGTAENDWQAGWPHSLLPPLGPAGAEASGTLGKPGRAPPTAKRPSHTPFFLITCS